MDALILILWVTIFLAAIPTGLCFYYYGKTSVKEYLFTGIAFIFGIISLYTSIPTTGPPVLLMDQIESIAYISVYFSFFLYAIRINADQSRKITYLGFLWYVSMIYFILSYQLTSVNEEMQVLFTHMKQNADSPPIVGTYQINGIIISGKGFEFLYDLFRIYVFGLILFMYLKSEIPLKTANTLNLWRIWIIAVSAHLVGALLLIGNSVQFWVIQPEIIDIFTFLTLILVAYIAIRHPEAFLITHSQLIRAFTLYGSTQKWDKEDQNLKFGLSSIVDYINSIPSDLKKLIENEQD